MIRYLKQYKLLLFLTVLFTAISSLSYVFIAILLQQVMDIVDMGDMDGFIRILLFSLVYFALRFLYKGIIIKHNKTEPTYTKTSLFLCEKRRFFMARTEKGVVTTI